MFFEDFDDKFNTLIAKSADLTNKPFLHSVVNINGEYERDNDGKRLDIYDLELELFRSNSELVLVISKLNFPNEPILWSGVKTIWMNSSCLLYTSDAADE